MDDTFARKCRATGPSLVRVLPGGFCPSDMATGTASINASIVGVNEAYGARWLSRPPAKVS